MSTGSAQYVLWRRDVYGNTSVMARFHSRKQAERACQSRKKRDEKCYWVTLLETGSV